MREARFSSWLAALGVLGGVAIALGLPYVVLAHGDGLSVTTKMLAIVLSLAGGGALVRAGHPKVESGVSHQHHSRRIT